MTSKIFPFISGVTSGVTCFDDKKIIVIFQLVIIPIFSLVLILSLGTIFF